MKAKELRIGNYVTIDNPNSWINLRDVPLIVTGVNNLITENEKNMFSHSDGKVWLRSEYETYGQFSQFISPIELNEEWLEKFGFDSNNVAYKIDNDRFIFQLYFYDAWNLNYVEKQRFGNGSVELSGYWKIHELQNLFFDFTGEELKIKE